MKLPSSVRVPQSAVAQSVSTAFVSGDIAAFEFIYDQYSTLLLRLILLREPNIIVAEQHLERCFLMAWHHREKYNTQQSLLTWLHWISKNISTNEQVKFALPISLNASITI